MRLTGVQNREEILEKLIHPCLLLEETLSSARSYLDVGSGAGIPGIMIKILHPDWQGTLLERSEKKCRFHHEAVRHLALKQIEIVSLDLKEFCRKEKRKFDYVFSRGVALDKTDFLRIRRLLSPQGTHYFYGEKNVPIAQEVSSQEGGQMSRSVAGGWEIKKMFHVEHSK